MNTEMEGNCEKTDASIVSRSSEPFIQIDSITIDLISSDDKIECGKCEHFSIRQFVSETRKKDWKTCWPFALDGDEKSGDQKALLPPLEIPNFSWWRCPNCQHEICSKDFHPVSKLGTVETRSTNICNSTNLNEYNNPSSYTGVRGKRAEVGGGISGNVIGSGDDGHMAMHRFSSLAPKIKSSVALERCINTSVAPKPESNGSRESCQSVHGSCKVGAVELGVANLKVNGKNQVENFQTGKHIPTDDACRLLCQASEICRVAEKGCNTTVGRDQSKRNPSVEVNRRILLASEFAEISVGNNIPDSHMHKSSGSLRRKSRKLRLLTELLGENGSVKNKKVVVTTNSPSNGTPDASTRIDTLYVPSSPVVVRGSNGEGSCQSRKRSLIQDEEWRPQEISSGNENKNVKALKKDMKTNDFRIGYKPEKPFGRTGSKTMKSRLSKSRLNREHMLDRRKYKKRKVLDSGFTLLLPRENVLQEIQEKPESLRSWMDSFPLTGERMESKSSSCAKKGNMQFKEVVEAPFFGNSDLLRPSSTTRENVETMRIQSVPLPFQSRADEFGRGLHLSLSSHMGAQRLDTNCVPLGGDRLPFFLPHQGGTSGSSQISRKGNENKAPFDFTSQFISSDALVIQGVQEELNKSASRYRIPFPDERQQLTPQCEDSVCSHLQRMAIAGPSSCVKNTEDRECLAIKKKQKDKRVDDACEKGFADDIPMEIVELMAKNQFERELYDAENKKHLSETENSTKKGPVACYGNSFSNESSKILQVQENQRPKSHVRNKNNGLIAAKEVVGPNKRSSADYLSHVSGRHFNPNHLQQTHCLEGYGEAIQSHMKTAREIQYSDAGSSKVGKPLHRKYWGNVEDHPRSSYSRVHEYEGCREHLSVSLQNEERARICSQMMLNPSSFGCNTRQNGSEKSKNADKFSDGHISMDKANFSAYSLQALSRKNAECPYSYQSTEVEIRQKPMNSLDLCSNETIPAMHLLSLMDAGMQSNPAFTPAGTSKFPKKSPFSINLKPDEFSRFDITSNKNIDAVRFPISDHYSRIHQSEKSIGHLPAGAALCKSTSFQQGKRLVRASNFSDKFSSKSTKRETTKRSAVSWKSNQNSQKCVVTSDGMVSDNNGALSFFDPADSTLFSLGCQKNRRISQHILEDHGSNALLSTSKRPIDTRVCTVNKNPSDFSLPEAGNIYTIGADDLKFGQNISNTIQSCSILSDGCKKRRNSKHNIINEYTRHLIQS